MALALRESELTNHTRNSEEDLLPSQTTEATSRQHACAGWFCVVAVDGNPRGILNSGCMLLHRRGFPRGTKIWELIKRADAYKYIYTNIFRVT